jgi:hypothetical protein
MKLETFLIIAAIIAIAFGVGWSSVAVFTFLVLGYAYFAFRHQHSAA